MLRKILQGLRSYQPADISRGAASFRFTRTDEARIATGKALLPKKGPSLTKAPPSLVTAQSPHLQKESTNPMLQDSLSALISINSPTVVEILSQSGYDWLMIDMEHGPLEVADVHALLQAKSSRCKALVRVPEDSLTTHLKRVLDLGCDGVIVPQIRTAEAAQRAMRACMYPPAGERGVGCARAQAYGMELAPYVTSANERLAIILQIEHADALAHLDSILATPNIAGILIGTYDLSASLGCMGDMKSQVVKNAIDTIRIKCQTRGVTVGIFTADPLAARAYRKQGFNFVVVAIDAMLLWKASQDLLATIRNHQPEIAEA